MKIRLRGRLSRPPGAEDCLATDTLSNTAGEQTREQLVQKLKSALAVAGDSLAEKFHRKEDVNQLVKTHAWVVDQLVLYAWEHLILGDQEVALLAVGGFGRGELHPHSDVDLLILLGESSPDKQLRTAIEGFVTLLWDAGFYLGHSHQSDGKSTAQWPDENAGRNAAGNRSR